MLLEPGCRYGLVDERTGVRGDGRCSPYAKKFVGSLRCWWYDGPCALGQGSNGCCMRLRNAHRREPCVLDATNKSTWHASVDEGDKSFGRLQSPAPGKLEISQNLLGE